MYHNKQFLGKEMSETSQENQWPGVNVIVEGTTIGTDRQ